MAQAGVALDRHAVPKNGFRGWPGADAKYLERLRKPIVIAALITGDLFAAIVAIAIGNSVIALVGIELPGRTQLSVALLILIFLGVQLYTGCGPSPYERFRLRTIGIAGFVGIELLVG